MRHERPPPFPTTDADTETKKDEWSGQRDAHHELADDYLRRVRGRAKGTPEAWKEAECGGEALIRATGGVRQAAQSLWDSRRRMGLDNLKGIHDHSLEGALDKDLLDYLRDIELNGAPARSTEARARVEAKPHQSALSALDQVYAQVWKDVNRGRVLVVPRSSVDRGGKDESNLEELLGDVHASSFGAVDKLNPDRTISAEKRVVHDQRGVNASVDSGSHPPACQPRHRQLARLALYWSSRYPKLPILAAKRDIEGAFRLAWLDPADASLFAGEMPWRPDCMAETDGEPSGARLPQSGPADRDPQGGLLAIYLVLSFGFNGAPGEWMAWATATKQFHFAHRPAITDRDGPERFQSEILMDDAVLVEPLLGLRPWVSASAYEAGAKLMLGEGAINAQKNAAEGPFRAQQTCWGLDLDLERMVVRVPERRILKGAHLLADAAFDPGNRRVKLLDVQRARGTAQSWIAVLPSLRTELRALDVFLGPGTSEGLVVCGAPAHREERAWTDLWEAFEFLRLVCARPEAWEARFTAGLARLLSPRERLALPGEAARVVFVSSDATPAVHAACDWTAHVAAREKVQPFMAALAEACEEDEVTIIALAELLGFIAFAAHQAKAWRGRLVAYVGDNTNVRDWLEKRAPRNVLARMLLRVLAYLELSGGFDVIAAHARTYHNRTSDLFTRCDDEEFKDLAEERGFTVVDLGAGWNKTLSACLEQRVPVLFGWDPADHGVAMKLRERRLERCLGKPPALQEWGALHEVGATTGDFAMAWKRLGGRCSMDGKRLCGGVAAYIGAETGEPEEGSLLAASLGPDASGREGSQAARLAVSSGGRGLVMEGPAQHPRGPVEQELRKGGWHLETFEYYTAEFGEFLTRRRWAILAAPARWTADAQQVLGTLRLPAGTPCGTALRPRRTVPDDDWVKAERLVVDPRLAAVRGALEPRAAAQAWFDGRRLLLPGTGGPLPWPHYAQGVREAILIMDANGPPGCARKISDEELWGLAGRDQGWLAATKPVDVEEAVRAGCRAAGARTAEALLLTLNAIVGDAGDRAGACRDPDSDAAARQMAEWLAKWRRGQFPRMADPSRRAGGASSRRLGAADDFYVHEAYVTMTLCVTWDFDYEQERRCGGPRAKKARISEGRRVAAAQLVRRPGPRGPTALDPLAEVEAEVEEHVADKLRGGLAPGTAVSYQRAWERWCWWARRHEWSAPYLLGETRQDTRQDEASLLSFAGYLSWRGLSPASVRQHLFAVQAAHKRGGAGDPLAAAPRVWLLLDGLKRGMPPRPRKLGVTPEMLEWLADSLVGPGPREEAEKSWEATTNRMVLHAALLVGFFYLCRAGEYLRSGRPDMDKVMRGVDFDLKMEGPEAQQQGTPDRLDVQFRKTKADQQAFGCVRTHYVIWGGRTRGSAW